MNLLSVQRTLGVLLILFSITMLPPLAVAIYSQDGNWQPFVESFLGILVVGAVCWWFGRSSRRELYLRDGFLVVSLFWIVLSGAGAAPFLLSDVTPMSFTDSVFEAVSGFTTTGATVLTGLDLMAPSFLYYRQQIHWFGGMGIVLLAVAVLPMLRIGGMQLMKAETPGPVKDTKLTPRLAETAKALWLVYVGLTAACAICYWIAGMSLFDAVGHAFSTLSTGGFSTHDLSLEYFDSLLIEVIAIVFMFLGGVNFSLQFLVWRQRSVRGYMADSEFRTYTAILLVMIVLYTLGLVIFEEGQTLVNALRVSAFQAVSMQTSTGFLTDDFSLWPLGLPVLVIFSTFIGGCAGSTAGGMKVIRWVVMWKQVAREFKRLLHPGAVIPLKVGQRVLDERVLASIRGFFTVYVMVFLLLMLLMISSGADVITAFGAIATCLNNTGPGLGEVVLTFSTVSAFPKWICIAAMLLGRLEIFPLIVILTPQFWRT